MSEDRKAPRCAAEVYRRDTYRVARGGGFRMHYERGQCRRSAKDGGLCSQHAKLEAKYPGIVKRRP